MGIVVHSPHSGRPVKVRDQDVGRAVRDEQQCIFYVLERLGGNGYYGAITRAGGSRDEQRYDQMLLKQEQARTTGHTETARQIHDATGPGRLRVRLKLLILLLAAAGVVGYLFSPIGPLGGARDDPAPSRSPADSEPEP